MRRRDLKEFQTTHSLLADYNGFVLNSKVVERDGVRAITCEVMLEGRIVERLVLLADQPPNSLKAALKRAERFGRQQGTAYVDLLLATARHLAIERKAQAEKESKP